MGRLKSCQGRLHSHILCCMQIYFFLALDEDEIIERFSLMYFDECEEVDSNGHKRFFFFNGNISTNQTLLQMRNSY